MKPRGNLLLLSGVVDDGSILIDIHDFMSEFPTLTPGREFTYRGTRYMFAKAEAPVIDENGRVLLGYVVAVPVPDSSETPL